jgi:glycerol-3-phosphate dehydrogenase (NAD(P)+)
VADELGAGARIALLSGPNHAEEIARGIPSATVIAAKDEDLRNFIQEVFHNDVFRVYASSDVTGVGLCGATKNVIAIAAGAIYGYGFGDNTAAVIMTRGCAEISRLVEAAGGDHRTSTGLAGIGDLIVTCGSKHSRNRRFGEFLGKGGTFEEFKKSTNMVVEGVNSCKAVLALAKKYGVEMPICEAVESVVFEGASIEAALSSLYARPMKDEF